MDNDPKRKETEDQDETEDRDEDENFLISVDDYYDLLMEQQEQM